MKEIQEQVKQFTTEKGLTTDVVIRTVDLSSEVGELSKEVLKSTDYGKKNFKPTEDFESEIGDVLFSLICIANEAEVDLKKSLEGALSKYEARFKNKGNIDSQE